MSVTDRSQTDADAAEREPQHWITYRAGWDARHLPGQRIPPRNAHMEGWNAGRAGLREEIAAWIDTLADEWRANPGAVVRLDVVAARIRAGVLK